MQKKMKMKKNEKKEKEKKLILACISFLRYIPELGSLIEMATVPEPKRKTCSYSFHREPLTSLIELSSLVTSDHLRGFIDQYGDILTLLTSMAHGESYRNRSSASARELLPSLSMNQALECT